MTQKNFKLGFLLFFVIFLGIFLTNSYAQEFDEYNVKIETVAENLQVPWAIVFSPDGRIFFTERVGNLRVIEDGLLQAEPVKILNVGTVEGGLLGIALDPEFEQNHFLYLYYTYNDFVFTYNRVVRLTEINNTLTDEKILIDKIPGGPIHDGGRMKFGPDGKFYVTTGDAANAPLAQDLNSLAGKILRINSDGTIPEDNPFPNSPIFSYGHRNPQGLDWDPITGKLVVTEHGSAAHDEINVIKPGANYGWPEVLGDQIKEGFEKPLLHTGEETWAPSGATFYYSNRISQWENKYFVATLRGSHLRMLDLDLKNGQVISSTPLFFKEFGRLRDVVVGPDENLYLLTSNQDGRGSPQENDDRILRIVPLIEAAKDETIKLLSPLKQYKQGVLPKDVSCKEGLELIIKITSGKPACVKHLTAEILEDRGWGLRTT